MEAVIEQANEVLQQEPSVDGWALEHNPAGHACTRCGARPSLLHQGRRRVSPGWEDVEECRLCLSCFVIAMDERSSAGREAA
jgi:hypothetical protein